MKKLIEVRTKQVKLQWHRPHSKLPPYDANWRPHVMSMREQTGPVVCINPRKFNMIATSTQYYILHILDCTIELVSTLLQTCGASRNSGTLNTVIWQGKTKRFPIGNCFLHEGKANHSRFTAILKFIALHSG